jgi:transcription initiation factor TFIIB
MSVKRGYDDLNYRVMCTDCKDTNPELIEDFASGDLICKRCGLGKKKEKK